MRIRREHVEAHPADVDGRNEFGGISYDLGKALSDLGRTGEAETAYRDARAAWEAVARTGRATPHTC